LGFPAEGADIVPSGLPAVVRSLSHFICHKAWALRASLVKHIWELENAGFDEGARDDLPPTHAMAARVSGYAEETSTERRGGLRFLRARDGYEDEAGSQRAREAKVAVTMIQEAEHARETAVKELREAITEEADSVVADMLGQALDAIATGVSSPREAAFALRVTADATALAGEVQRVRYAAAMRGLRDLLVWRTQLRAPLEDRNWFISELQGALSLDLGSNPDITSSLLHAHGRLVGGRFRQAFLSRTAATRGTRTRRGREREAGEGLYSVPEEDGQCEVNCRETTSGLTWLGGWDHEEGDGARGSADHWEARRPPGLDRDGGAQTSQHSTGDQRLHEVARGNPDQEQPLLVVCELSRLADWEPAGWGERQESDTVLRSGHVLRARPEALALIAEVATEPTCALAIVTDLRYWLGTQAVRHLLEKAIPGASWSVDSSLLGKWNDHHTT